MAFENLILGSGSRDGIEVLRIPAGCETRKVRGPRGPMNKLVRVQSPFDFCAFSIGRTIVFDAKTVESDRFTHSAIVPHQLIYLARAARHVASSGYLIWFRDPDQVAWFSALKLSRLRPRESLKISDSSIILGNHMDFSLVPLFKGSLDLDSSRLPAD